MTPTQLPDPAIVESLLATIERYPFATLSLILFAAVVAFGIHAYRRK